MALKILVNPAKNHIMNITKREKEVIKKLSEGLTTKEVARDLFLSPYTIETHKRNIFQKLQARTLVQLGAIAVRHGIIVVLSCFMFLTPCISQNQFEIEGGIKTKKLLPYEVVCNTDQTPFHAGNNIEDFDIRNENNPNLILAD